MQASAIAITAGCRALAEDVCLRTFVLSGRCAPSRHSVPVDVAVECPARSMQLVRGGMLSHSATCRIGRMQVHAPCHRPLVLARCCNQQLRSRTGRSRFRCVHCKSLGKQPCTTDARSLVTLSTSAGAMRYRQPKQTKRCDRSVISQSKTLRIRRI